MYRLFGVLLLVVVFLSGIALACGGADDQATITSAGDNNLDQTPAYTPHLPASFDSLPPEKQAEALKEFEQQKQALARPQASPDPEAPSVLSCPTDVSRLATGIGPFRFGPFGGGRNLVNQAGAVSKEGVPYWIFAGATDEDPEQGTILVLQESLDPCATAAGLIERTPLGRFEFPGKPGALTLTTIERDTVTFAAADGTKGRFDYTNGKYLTP